jgi:exopolyphosphatase/guanosine-5'-triphosphate,3'-diphosphate pyrophosphatase
MRYLDDDGSISEEGVEAIIAAVTEAAKVARESGIDEMLAFATSAIREATNGAEVLQRAEDAAGIRLDVLSGADEARITFLAVRRWYGWSAGRVLLFDIGGGSLEIAHGGDEIPDVASSVPLGAGRSTIRFLSDDPPSEKQVKRLREHARELLEATVDEFGGIPESDHVVGSSKTIRSLAKLAGSTEEGVGSEERSILKLSHLDDWIPRLARIPADARPALPGITEDRTFQIVAGGIVLSETMRAFKAKTLEVSPWALREGLILRRLDRMT